MYSVFICAAFLAIRTSLAQWPSHLDVEELSDSPGHLPPGIDPPGESGGCCSGLPVATPMPEVPLPICPGGVPPIFAPEGSHVLACLPTSETCPPNSACWYNGIDYYCCPMEGAPGYGATPRPPLGYGGVGGDGGRRPGGRGRPPSGSPSVDLPGSLPKGVNPPSELGESSSEDVSPPGSAPKGISPPSSGEDNAPPGSLPKNVRPPASSGGSKPRPGGQFPWKKKARPLGPRPPTDTDTFPNPFTCCGGGFHPPSHLPKNINAPSERAIGYIQFHGGHNVWPPKETGKSKFGGPIKPDILWFPGQHAHLTNELACCGEGSGGGPSYVSPATPSPPSGHGRPQLSKRK